MSKEFDAMKRLEREDEIPLKQAGPLIKGRPSLRSLYRYVLYGYRCPVADDLIFLEAYRGTGRSYWTSRQACERFNALLNGDDT